MAEYVLSDLRREDLAWAAGLVEGEGTFSLSLKRPGAKGHAPPGARYVNVAVTMTDEDVVRRLATMLGLNVRGPYTTRSKPLWMASTGAFERAQAIVAMLWPWLGDRRKAQAIRMLQGQSAQRRCGLSDEERRERRNARNREWYRASKSKQGA